MPHTVSSLLPGSPPGQTFRTRTAADKHAGQLARQLVYKLFALDPKGLPVIRYAPAPARGTSDAQAHMFAAASQTAGLRPGEVGTVRFLDAVRLVRRYLVGMTYTALPPGTRGRRLVADMWANVDWSQSNTDIARALKVRPSSVGRQRARRHAPANPRAHRPKPPVEWNKIDWRNRKIVDVAQETGYSPSSVAIHRRHALAARAHRTPRINRP